MWPLFCNEIALSYDQEEKIRLVQKEIISNQETWLHRHTTASTEHVIETSHAAICGISEAAEKRAKIMMDVLTPVQKVKFLLWIAQKKQKDSVRLGKLASCPLYAASSPSSTIAIDSKRCDAANVYILNHKLKVVADSYECAKLKLFSQQDLKKLSRRPAFESLASVEEGKSTTKGSMTKVGSSGALKRCSSELSCDNGRSYLKKSSSVTSLGIVSSITPDGAQATYATYVYQALGNIKHVIPAHRLIRHARNHEENTQSQPAASTAIRIQDQTTKRKEMDNYNLERFPSNALYAVDCAYPTTLPSSLISTSRSQGQPQNLLSLPIPDPIPIMPSHRNTLLGSYLASAFDPLATESSSSSYTHNFSGTREQQTYISTAASAPNFCAFSKGHSPVQSAPKDEDFANLDDLGLWNVSNQMADDSLFDLTEEDWAIGEGAFLDES